MTGETKNEDNNQDVESLNTDDLAFFAEKKARQVVGRVISTNFTYLMAGLNGISFQSLRVYPRLKLTPYYRQCHWRVDPLYPTGIWNRSPPSLLCLPHQLRRLALRVIYQHPHMLKTRYRGDACRGSRCPVLGLWTHVLETPVSSLHSGLLLDRNGSCVSGCAV